jgi:hypothetical protein
MIKTSNRSTRVLKAAAITLGYMIGGVSIMSLWAYLLIKHVWIAGAILGVAVVRLIFKEVLKDIEKKEGTTV